MEESTHDEMNNIENIKDYLTHEPTPDTTQDEIKHKKNNLEEKRKLYNQKRRERRLLKKKN